MKKLRVKAVLLITVIAMMSPSINLVNAFQTKRFDNVTELAKYATQNEVNIMLYDEKGKILKEIHSNGLNVEEIK